MRVMLQGCTVGFIGVGRVTVAVQARLASANGVQGQHGSDQMGEARNGAPLPAELRRLGRQKNGLGGWCWVCGAGAEPRRRQQASLLGLGPPAAARAPSGGGILLELPHAVLLGHLPAALPLLHVQPVLHPLPGGACRARGSGGQERW